MHDPLGMQRSEPSEHGVSYPESLRHRKTTLPRSLSERPAREELHREVDVLAAPPKLVDADEMGAQALPGDADLPAETNERPLRIALRVDHLEGDLCFEEPIEDPIDGRIAAATETFPDLISICQETAGGPPARRLGEGRYRLRFARLKHKRPTASGTKYIAESPT